jgi:hypothetical protein
LASNTKDQARTEASLKKKELQAREAAEAEARANKPTAKAKKAKVAGN